MKIRKLLLGIVCLSIIGSVAQAQTDDNTQKTDTVYHEGALIEQKLEEIFLDSDIEFMEDLDTNPDTLLPQQTKSDTTYIRFGKKQVVIVEKEGSTILEFPESKNIPAQSSSATSSVSKKKRKFSGHWAGFEWGFNGIMTPDHSVNMTGDLKFMELKQERSWNFNINPFEYNFGLGSSNIGLVTGVGFEFNNYNFRNPINLKIENGITVPDSSYFSNPGLNVTKSKLFTSHLTVPLLLEFQIPKSHRNKRFYISTGVIGGVKLSSSTKVKYEGVKKGSDKAKGNFNLSSFRYGLTARVGFSNLGLYANYYPTAMFEKDKGPEVYPFSIGLILLSF